MQNPSKVFSPENVIEGKKNTLPEPVMNMDSLFKLADFLDTSKSDSSFPEITVIPDMLRSVGKFVNERKKMKYSHKEFEMKIKFLSDGVDKQYHVAMQKIQNETEIQLAQINGNVRQGILSINRYYDLEVQKVVRDEIGQLLVDIGKKKVQVTAAEKKELYDVKDTCVKTTRYLYDRMIAIQSKTGELRDKIRDECGSRGKAWFDKIQKNKK